MASDTELVVSKKYGVCGPGDKRTPRISVLISPDGKIIQTFTDVDPKTHADTVLRAVSNR